MSSNVELNPAETFRITSENSELLVKNEKGYLKIVSTKKIQSRKQLRVREYLERLTTQKDKWLKFYDHYAHQFELYCAGYKHHHIQKGGLEKHTAQVIQVALDLRDMRKDLLNGVVSDDDIIIAGFIHDFSKIRSYIPLEEGEQKKFEKQEFKCNNQLGCLDPETWTLQRLMKFEIMITPEQMNALFLAEGGFSLWAKACNHPDWTPLAALISCADNYSAQIIKR